MMNYNEISEFTIPMQLHTLLKIPRRSFPHTYKPNEWNGTQLPSSWYNAGLLHVMILIKRSHGSPRLHDSSTVSPLPTY